MYGYIHMFLHLYVCTIAHFEFGVAGVFHPLFSSRLLRRWQRRRPFLVLSFSFTSFHSHTERERHTHTSAYSTALYYLVIALVLLSYLNYHITITKRFSASCMSPQYYLRSFLSLFYAPFKLCFWR